MPSNAFLGRSFIVTGGASGIGFGVVKKLLGLSATVHVLDLAASLPNDPQGASDRLNFYPRTDVSSREAIKATFQSILEKSPDIHGLVNCAGISPRDTFIPESDEDFNNTMAVNLHGVWNTGAEYLRYISAKYPHDRPDNVNIGSMVNIGSTSWANDFAPRVRVNCVAPGITETPMLQKQVALGERMDAYNAAIPMTRLGSCEEIADSVVFLLGDGSSYITGQVLPVSGGLV
ncbi:NAD(P)-binding protein [Aspergillus heteromorphus CBS 117.55]|uniref:NAD(P)-binding protein n=1 Tax=Aspergillus heteromorphus CBS 117.55 TaxID=1448321 RepID=A0A317W691_9EURO|nr:NAD(P)-binding protein [Aspergillus heteromorphus CBS 117.55]PWY82124.1 NAD(P)-binding protein [Aspergillus heteromorphus CBS 117.55]